MGIPVHFLTISLTLGSSFPFRIRWPWFARVLNGSFGAKSISTGIAPSILHRLGCCLRATEGVRKELFWIVRALAEAAFSVLSWLSFFSKRWWAFSNVSWYVVLLLAAFRYFKRVEYCFRAVNAWERRWDKTKRRARNCDCFSVHVRLRYLDKAVVH